MKTSVLSADLFWESQAAERFGISRTRIRELRKSRLAPEVDWQFRDNAVVLTTSGLQKIELALSGSTPAATPAPQAPTPPASAPAPAPSAPPPAVSTLPAPPSPATAPRAPAALPPGPPPRAKFIVWRVPTHRLDARQRHILICREALPSTQQTASWLLHTVPGLGVERPIRVRDNANFLPGMVLEAVNIGHGLWQYVGRLPRRQGRW